MPKLLLTGFDPFAHYQINPSWEAVRSLEDEIGGFAISKLLLPNIYGLASKMLLDRAEALQPDIILMLGMDSGSKHVHLDTVAVNLRDALIEDNLGCKPWNEPVLPGAPFAYRATVPVHDIVRSLQGRGVPVHIGYTTGAYVCNEIFYSACHRYAGSRTQVGFAHVPLLPEMVWEEELAQPLGVTVEQVHQIILELARCRENAHTQPQANT